MTSENRPYTNGKVNGFHAHAPSYGEYALARGAAAVRRLLLLHTIYSPAGHRILLRAGLRAGMRVADFGCGVGAATRMLAEMVGPKGEVTGIDSDENQLVQAGGHCSRAALRNVSFWRADACDTRLPAQYFDLVYARFLLMHLPNPMDGLREMYRVLKPGGLIVVEDGDVGTAGSTPPTALSEFAHLFSELGPIRGVDYLIGRDLFHLVKDCGFQDVDIEIHQPTAVHGEARNFLKWSVEEGGIALVAAGLVTAQELGRMLDEMQQAIENPDVLVIMPRMSQVWGRKGE